MCNIAARRNRNFIPLKISAICNKFRLIIPKAGILIRYSVVSESRLLGSQATTSCSPMCENIKLI